MPKIDRHWAERQLATAGVSPWVEDAVLDLLACWLELEVDDDDIDHAVSFFADLARGRHIAPTDPTTEGYWIPARIGRIRPGQRVRVRMDAFTGELGDLHNGRAGVVVTVGDGDVIVRSIDTRKPRLMAAHYAPYVLEEFIPR